jgi:glycosyltransferase involved in cell wall biosynthesis
MLPAGSHEVIFEGCDVAGDWRRLGSTSLSGQGNAADPPPPQPVAPHEFARCLQLALRFSVREPLELAAARVAGLLPRPQSVRYPHLPFHGHLHIPAALEHVLFGRLHLEGWLFHETQAIRRVAATVDLQALQSLKHGMELPYIADQFPQFPQARHSQFVGIIDLPAQLPAPATVRVYAELVDGTWHLCSVQRFTPIDDEQAKAPFPSFNLRQFARLTRLLRRALHDQDFAVPMTPAWRSEVRAALAEYQARATRLPPTAAPVRPNAASKPPHHVALITHNLSYEGAPLFLLEYARHLAGTGVKLAVVTAADGPLRAGYEELGATVQIMDLAPLHSACDVVQLQAALRGIAAVIDLRGIDLVVANTLSAFWGVHLAHQAGRPSLFYIHESTTPAAHFHGHLPAALLPEIGRAFALATHVSFLTDSTRRYYRPLLPLANHSLNPGWIDLARLDRHLATRPRAALRRALGLDDSTRLVVNLGSVCNRKGQHIFARAVDLLWRRRPDLAASALFLMVGGRDSHYDHAMAELLETLARPNLRIIPETARPLDYLGAADLFVCSSYEESFPRVVLEAMACRVPVLSTKVHGIPEIARPDLEAVLVPPGDTVTLSEGMAKMLSSPELGRTLAVRARARVAAEFDSARLLPRHAALAAVVAAQVPSS